MMQVVFFISWKFVDETCSLTFLSGSVNFEMVSVNFQRNESFWVFGICVLEQKKRLQSSSRLLISEFSLMGKKGLCKILWKNSINIWKGSNHRRNEKQVKRIIGFSGFKILIRGAEHYAQHTLNLGQNELKICS